MSRNDKKPGLVTAVASAAPLRRAQQHDRDSDAARLARGIAHDFNNLLAIIGGYVQLAHGRTTDPTASTYLREAELACQMGARLTQRIMTFAEDRHLSPVKIDIFELLTKHAALLRNILGQAVTLTIDVASSARPVFADPSALENAIVNLCLNARDALPDGGTVIIRAVYMSAEDKIRITVGDNGSGMAADVMARAFLPFFTTKDPGRGTGLGLATVKGFANQSGGSAKIESQPGKGTTVSIYLPACGPIAAKAGA